MPQTDRHKEREIPIEFDFYNTLESLPMNNRCTIIMVSCGNATIKINNHIIYKISIRVFKNFITICFSYKYVIINICEQITWNMCYMHKR